MSNIPTITTTEAPAPPANLNPVHQQATEEGGTATYTPSSAGAPASSSSSSGSGSKLPIEYTKFLPPIPEGVLPTWSIVIEFCDRCRWLHRATWVQTELFVTFGEKKDEPRSDHVQSITLLPMTKDETAGRFRVWVYGSKGAGGAQSTGPQSQVPNASRAICVYDRKIKGGFPELKELKQLIRDVISPNQSLGHSDHTQAPLEQGQKDQQGKSTKTTWATGHESNVGTASIAAAHD
ncbi:unnamed protein product [Sympodiomycopsis kandeliae]